MYHFWQVSDEISRRFRVTCHDLEAVTFSEFILEMKCVSYATHFTVSHDSDTVSQILCLRSFRENSTNFIEFSDLSCQLSVTEYFSLQKVGWHVSKMRDWHDVITWSKNRTYLLHRVSGEYDRCLLFQILNHLPHMSPVHWVHSCTRLVHKDDTGSTDGSYGDTETSDRCQIDILCQRSERKFTSSYRQKKFWRGGFGRPINPFCSISPPQIRNHSEISQKSWRHLGSNPRPTWISASAAAP